MRDTEKMKWQAIRYYEGESSSDEDNYDADDTPYILDHITLEKLHREDIEDISDDHLLELIKLYKEDKEDEGGR